MFFCLENMLKRMRAERVHKIQFNSKSIRNWGGVYMRNPNATHHFWLYVFSLFLTSNENDIELDFRIK